ncbi:questin oxidase family protein [Streptomyces sp. NBC_00289]|uniref:hypothetical protein n=1 Tax=Streptomyces sp. NBC_00289 TaxID=2975703 RepID=UPI00324E178C
MAALSYTDAVNEALERLRGVGFEHGPRFVNHAPMAAEALAHMGYTDEVPGWVDRNLRTRTYHDVPELRWAIDPADRAGWQAALGDFARVGDWTALFERELSEDEWTEVLARWWPRLLPGMSGVLTHGVIRTAHAVRAVAAAGPDNHRQLSELAQGLGYWAARYAGHGAPVDDSDSGELAADPDPDPDPDPDAGADANTGAGALGDGRRDDGRNRDRDRDRVHDHGEGDGHDDGDGDGHGRDPAARALDELVAEYSGIYATVAQRHPIPLIHSVTGPAAVRLVIEYLPPAQRWPSYRVARSLSRTMLDWFQATPRPQAPLPEAPDVDEVFANAVQIGDEHAIKLAEVAVRHEAIAPDPRHAAAAQIANQGLGRLYL